MFVLSLLDGLLIPHVPRKRSMLSFHSVGSLQAVTLLVFGAVWPLVYPPSQDKKSGTAAAWCNIMGKWGNMVGFTYSSLTGARCLLYWTKHENPAIHAVGSVTETILEVILKAQGRRYNATYLNNLGQQERHVSESNKKAEKVEEDVGLCANRLGLPLPKCSG